MSAPDDATITLTMTGDARRLRGGLLRGEAALYLVVQCDDLAAGGCRYTLDGVGEVLLGRGAARAAARQLAEGVTRLAISVADPRMSSKHARLVRSGRQWLLEDLGSKNGSQVDGHVVRRTAEVADGSIIEVGMSLFLFMAADAASDAGPQVACGAYVTPPGAGMATLGPGLAHLYADLASLGDSAGPVAILGETGTGKEVLARALHGLSRPRGPFVAVNCGAIPAGLVESELFGHRKGAFSGADADRIGLVRSADGGTLFLDEIGDLPIKAQASLLRVLEQREVVPVGGRRPEKVDLRVISATHRNIDAMVAAGDFRRDLWGRLSGYVARLPPLRDRRQDLGLLIAVLLSRLAPSRAREITMAREVGRRMLVHAWPQNIRELAHVLGAAVSLAKGGAIAVEQLPRDLGTEPQRDAPRRHRVGSVRRGEASHKRRKDAMLAALQAHGGNVVAASAEVGYARQVFYRWMEQYSIDPEKYRR